MTAATALREPLVTDKARGPVSVDARLLEQLRRGDEAAFRSLVECYHSAMVRVAMAHVRSRAVAEDVVQETWLGVLRGLHRFEGRASLKTWIFRILVNRAKSRGISERRCVTLSTLVADDAEDATVDPDRFVGPGNGDAGRWAVEPLPFGDLTADGVLTAELRSHIEAAIAALTPRQRQVMTLRDVEGWSSEEVCAVLGLTEANQRVLLHRARCSVRSRLEDYVSSHRRPTPDSRAS
jgi:RNA polymerase sigma-70 factor (ECF subfamily)